MNKQTNIQTNRQKDLALDLTPYFAKGHLKTVMRVLFNWKGVNNHHGLYVIIAGAMKDTRSS